jgi:hypothetical protein
LARDMLALLVLAIPEAFEEFIAFVRIVVVADDPKQQGDLLQALENPEIDVLIAIAEVVVEQEVDDLESLMGKAQAAGTRIGGLYQNRSRSKAG